MIKLYDLSHSEEWDAIVKSFDDHDVYYLSGYVKAFHLHGDGDPFLLYYEESSLRAIYVYMRRLTDIEGVFDSITPYGYGGVLFEGDDSEENKASFWSEYMTTMEHEHIVDNFVRYHPVLRNAWSMKSISNVIDLGKTIAMDLSSPEIIWENIHSKNRNMIRKAEKNGIVIEHGKGMNLFDKFIEIYNATMDKDHAEEYYYFKRPFYESIHNDLSDNYEMFYAKLEEKIIAMSIMIFANGRMNYHLSGSDMQYRHLAPSNLLLYKAAQWGCEQGFKTLHLGGGVGSGEDNLYKFKVAFNKKSDFQFSIGKQIFNQPLYDELVRIRRESDAEFNEASGYFPVYRA
ncbi:MAG: GNAT family N-acetyltransferase [Bacteroidales bacterium]|nr:GNAT family N-acetyltransferase [Bacteroidales bacterium]